MSYVIQNFYYPTSFIRATLRTRSVFLIRNYAFIYLLFSNTTKSYNLIATTYKVARFAFRLGGTKFNALTKVLFSNLSSTKYNPLGVNFPLSAHYVALFNINNLISYKAQRLATVRNTESYFEYPYFDGAQIAITPVSGKPSACAVYKFLRLSLNLWFYWPKRYIILTHYTNLNNSWLFLPFLNKSFFKIYNV